MNVGSPGSAISSATVRNNIFSVGAGYALTSTRRRWAASAATTTRCYTTGTGKLARWQGRDFTDLADWYYEVGYDQHSQVADPRFVCRRPRRRTRLRHVGRRRPVLTMATPASRRQLDHVDRRFTATTAAPSTDSSVATWEFTGLTPGWYDVAATWTAFPDLDRAVYTVSDGDTVPAG